MNRKIVIALIFISMIAISLRLIPLIQGQFIDSDSMAAILTIKQAIATHTIYAPELLAGFPAHPYYYAEQGVVEAIVNFYNLTGGVLGIFGTAYVLDAIMICLSVVVIYLFAKKLMHDKTAGVFAAILYTISITGIYIQAFNRFAGDSYMPILFLSSILLLLYALDEHKIARKLMLMVGSLIVLALAFFVWAGGEYAIAAYIVVALALVLNTRIKRMGVTLLLIIILTIIGWAAIYATNVAGIAQSLGNFPTGTALYIGMAQMVAQNIPQNYGLSPFYYGLLTGNFIEAVPYWMFLAATFLSSTFLAVIAICKFKPANKEEQRTYLTLLTLVIFGSSFGLVLMRGLFYLPIVILGGAAFTVKLNKRSPILLFIIIGTMLIALSFNFINIAMTPVYQTLTPEYHSTMLWIANNTAQNATFLTWAGDGTPLEYWANRTSYSDTNIGDYPLVITQFQQFLFAQALNFSYLDAVHPDYLLVNHYWIMNGLQYLDNYTNRSINGTNLQLIEQGYAMITSYNGTDLMLVYDQNGTAIYRVDYGQ